MKNVKIGSKILKAARILGVLTLISSGFNIFFQYIPMSTMSKELMSVFGSLMNIKWLLPLVAITEIVGGLLFVLSKTRALGEIILLPVLIGVTLHHLVYDVAWGIIGYILLLITLLSIIDNSDKYKSLVQ